MCEILSYKLKLWLLPSYSTKTYIKKSSCQECMMVNWIYLAQNKSNVIYKEC